MAGLTQPILAVELVPSTCWGSNLRSELSAADWRVCQQFVYQRSGRRCEICKGVGPRWPVECHETWRYVERGAPTQVLTGLIALCPTCHRCKHAGFAEAQGLIHLVVRQLMTVNQWSEQGASEYLEWAFEVWAFRSQHEWDLDTTWLVEIGLAGSHFSAKARSEKRPE